MLFSSTIFLFAFLAATLFLYYVVFHKTKPRNILLFVFSLIFYAWGEPVFVLVMIASIVANWIFGLLVEKYRDRPKIEKAVLILMAVFNLSLLFVFKYLTFVLSSVNSLFHAQITIPVIRLPIGISFFTFQSISYVVDVWRKKAGVQRSLIHVGLYISLFPQLIAGPIVRYETIADEIDNRHETVTDFSEGCCRFIIGLAKKVLISNIMAQIADTAFNSPSDELSVAFAWLGAIAYTFQIYFDFSGYSDMAIGLGKMFGFHFEENFRYPYIARSITDFWRRWHISLSTWFRDYVYIPLGGNRGTAMRKVFNLFVVWLLTGIWHGASWNFIVWGLYYFVLLLIERSFFKNYIRKDANPRLFPRILGHIYTLVAVIVGWVFFRAETLPAAFSYLSTMFGNSSARFDVNFFRYFDENWIFFAAAFLFSMPMAKLPDALINRCNNRSLGAVLNGVKSVLYPILLISAFLLSVAYLVKGSYNPFIYFNF